MPSTPSLILRLKADYPQFGFKPSDNFLWSPTEQTIYYIADEVGAGFVLHELCHGILGHTGYDHDIELLAMEGAAWDKAVEISKRYALSIDGELIQSTLDTYRDWLHARSACPECRATGLQIKKQLYACPACQHSWRVNEARICALRRFTA
ncbi:MAG: hypothetical protein ABI716_03195 [Candidatus Saccharibacteria bacterium]